MASDNGMTAVALEVLLHHYYRPQQINRPTKAQEEAYERLLRAGLLDYENEYQEGEAIPTKVYTITQMGKFHVETLIDHPLPRIVETFGYPE